MHVMHTLAHVLRNGLCFKPKSDASSSCLASELLSSPQGICSTAFGGTCRPSEHGQDGNDDMVQGAGLTTALQSATSPPTPQQWQVYHYVL